MSLYSSLAQRIMLGMSNFVHLCFSRLVCLILIGIIWIGTASWAALASNHPGQPRPADEVVREILTTKCLGCHGADKKRGGLDLSRRAAALAGGESGPAITPGNPTVSLIFKKISAGEMPPNNPLSNSQVAAFRQWIATGARYEVEPLAPVHEKAGPDWWSLQPLRRPAIPNPNRKDWVRTPIDAFVLAKLEERNLNPAPEADRLTLLRRVTFDLIGLPPTPEEIADFQADSSPNAYEKHIDRLLNSPHYGERWARHWLDVVRFAESHGYETNELRPGAWPYRDYVIRSFNEDKPYPQFILEQLAGDSLAGVDWLTQAATGFLVGGAHDVVGNQTTDGMLQQRMDDLDDMVGTTSATFLGLTVSCSRCHDHKFDPISQRDYYGMQAVFAGVQHAEREVVPPDAERRKREAARVVAELSLIDRRLDEEEPPASLDASAVRRRPVNARRNVERFRPTMARAVRFTVLATSDKLEPCIDELEIYAASGSENHALASYGASTKASSVFPNSTIHKLEHLNDGRYGNGRSWISSEPGKGWVEVRLGKPTLIDRIVWGRDREEKFKDRLAKEYSFEVEIQPGEWVTVASSADRLPKSGTFASPQSHLQQERQRLESLLRSYQSTIKIYSGTFAAPGPTHVLNRGDPMSKADRVTPAALAVVRPALRLADKATDGERRLALGRWLGQAENPLPARVMVNRLWHYHFGQGIVATPSDFGYNGDRPSHPELLDWLGSEFQRNGWQLKPLHRLMVTSAAYRQSSRIDAHAKQIDSQNRLVWRMTPRRLEAESLRDAILCVSGKLNRAMGGPGYSLWEKNTNYVVVFKPKERLDTEEFRRMIYQFKPRSQHDPTFGIFDCPDAALAKPRRTASTTALQALNLLNGSFALAQADQFAERLRRDAGPDFELQARRAFALCFGRQPAEPELSAALRLARAMGISALCRALYNANEFLYVD